MKKSLALIVVAAVVVLASCRGHRTCPTYLKNSTENSEISASTK